jgi:hypothetical protein
MATEFKQGYALVWDGLSWRFIDTKGNFVSPSFAEATQFASGKSTVSLAGPLYSFIAAQELESARVSSDDIKKDAAAAKRQDPQDGPDQQVAPDQQGEGD